MNYPIIIPGSYRSGTSYLAGKIHEAGVKMIATDGEKHYEERLMYELIEGEMRYAAWDKDNLQERFFRSIPFEHHPSEHFMKRLHDYKAERDAEGVPYGFKMPQIVWFMANFVEVWPEAYYVLCLRNSLSAGWSQQKRGAIPLQQHDVLIVHRHLQYISNCCCIAKNKGLRMHVFNYDGDMEREQDALCAFLDMDLDLSDFKWSCGKRRVLPKHRQNMEQVVNLMKEIHEKT